MLSINKEAPLGIRLIAGTKILKGVVLCFLTLGVFDLVHRDVGALALHFVQILRISPENRYVELLLEKLGLIDPPAIRRLGELSGLYAAVELIEGLGLWFGAVWAEFVVVTSTGIFIPEEFLSLHRHFTWFKLSILLINAAIFVYVAMVVWNRYLLRKASKAAAEKADGDHDAPAPTKL
jgi:uncharacterized membrane protein (DUF2068 family)